MYFLNFTYPNADLLLQQCFNNENIPNSNIFQVSLEAMIFYILSYYFPILLFSKALIFVFGKFYLKQMLINNLWLTAPRGTTPVN